VNEEELYLFDLNGYLVVEQVLTVAEVAAANTAIDHHADAVNIRLEDLSLSGESTSLKGTTGRGDLGGMLGWEEPWRNVFRHMLSHPRIVPYLNQIVGPGFRMDHSPGLITMRKGAEGHTLHGSSGPHFDPNQYYVYRDGQMHNGLTVVAWQLSDVEEGDGGLCLIPGSHKANFACPRPIKLWHRRREIVRPITCRAGDVVIFTEAVTHGTLPWRSERERRSLLYRYTPANLAYATGYMPWPEQMLEGMTPEQRAILEPPYHRRLNRPELDDAGRLRETAN
jgi:ectoine hydroxylase-related dioxygenase (phytanoyl-CoA dioxygenase family)